MRVFLCFWVGEGVGVEVLERRGEGFFLFRRLSR